MTPHCRYHKLAMIPHREKIPFLALSELKVHVQRISYRCPLAECPCVAVGESEYGQPAYVERQIRKGYRAMSQL